MEELQVEKARAEGKIIGGENEDEPPIPACIIDLKMSEPKLRNYKQIAKVLHGELGDSDYKVVVNR